MVRSRQQDFISIILFLAILAGSSLRSMDFGAGSAISITQEALRPSITIARMIFISKDLLRKLLRAIIHTMNGCRFLKEIISKMRKNRRIMKQNHKKLDFGLLNDLLRQEFITESHCLL